MKEKNIFLKKLHLAFIISSFFFYFNYRRVDVFSKKNVSIIILVILIFLPQNNFFMTNIEHWIKTKAIRKKLFFQLERWQVFWFSLCTLERLLKNWAWFVRKINFYFFYLINIMRSLINQPFNPKTFLNWFKNSKLNKKKFLALISFFNFFFNDIKT